jgi:hypothetical protein
MKLSLTLTLAHLLIAGTPLAFGAATKEDSNKVADIDGVHYTGVSWGPRRGNVIPMYHNGGTMEVPLEKVPPKVLAGYGMNATAIRAQARQARQQEVAEATARGAYLIDGKVIQKLRAGLLVDSGTEMRREMEQLAERLRSPGAVVIKSYPVPLQKNGRTVYEGWCLLKGHPSEAGIVDDDKISIRAVLEGTYSYTTVSGASKTIRSFNAER